MSQNNLFATRELIAMVNTLAREYPSKVTNGTYIQDGHPNCIIGHALAALDALDFEEEGTSENETFIEELLPLYTQDYTPDQIQWLGQVQFAQDMGTSWGLAVERANHSLPNVLGSAGTSSATPDDPEPDYEEAALAKRDPQAEMDAAEDRYDKEWS